MQKLPEVWLRGPLRDVRPSVTPVVHSLLQVREELEATIPALSREQIWSRPGPAASVGFHLKHLAGSLDRLLTYARGESLSDAQLAYLNSEELIGSEPPAELLRLAIARIDAAIEQTVNTPETTLGEPRAVGRAALPSTVLGLLFHAAEHTQRHAGQIITTAKFVRQSR